MIANSLNRKCSVSRVTSMKCVSFAYNLERLICYLMQRLRGYDACLVLGTLKQMPGPKLRVC